MKKASFLFSTTDLELYEYRGDPFHPFMIRMDSTSLQARIRLFFEWFMGRKVYYIKMKSNDKWVGYCAVVNGINPRCKFADKEDIVFGHYMIAEEFRGRGLSVRLLHAVMDQAVTNYRYAYAYVKKENVISQKAITSFGAEKIGELKIVGLTRRIRSCEQNGNYYLYRKAGKVVVS